LCQLLGLLVEHFGFLHFVLLLAGSGFSIQSAIFEKKRNWIGYLAMALVKEVADPQDIHDYTRWSRAGRSETMDKLDDLGGEDGD
jgi:hypothetical protein